MRTIQYQEIINNIKEMCIEANHFLSEDMKKAFETAKNIHCIWHGVRCVLHPNPL